MGDQNLLKSLLQNTQKHPTVIGNVWLMALFVFRILVVGAAVQAVWADEHSEFICNTQQPGCNAAFPLSHIRFWVLQIISVSTPTFFYLAYVLHVILQDDEKVNNEEEMKERWNGRGVSLRRQSEADGGDTSKKIRLAQKDDKLSVLSGHGKTFMAGHLLKIYVGSIVFKIMIEIAFIVGQCYLYGLQLLPQYRCSETPCPNWVDCVISHTKEKTFFILFMLTIACVSLLLNVLEICNLGSKKFKQRPKSPTFAQLFSGVKRKVFTKEEEVSEDLLLEMGVAQSGHEVPVSTSIIAPTGKNQEVLQDGMEERKAILVIAERNTLMKY